MIETRMNVAVTVICDVCSEAKKENVRGVALLRDEIEIDSVPCTEDIAQVEVALPAEWIQTKNGSQVCPGCAKDIDESAVAHRASPAPPASPNRLRGVFGMAPPASSKAKT